MRSINFFYKKEWTAWEAGNSDPYKITEDVLALIEAIRTENWPEEKISNISFDIYWCDGEYSGIHNYRMGDTHNQVRYNGFLEIPG
jgi:hypothetical protein